MLTWKQTLIAYLNGYSYAITEGDRPDNWRVEITTPDGNMDVNACNTIEEAKEYCERTAAEAQE